MTVTVVQNVGSGVSAANKTVTITTTTAGHNIVAIYARSGGLATGALTSVTDSASQTWTRATRGAVSGVSNTRIEIWYVENSASITSVTFNSGTAQTNSWDILEVTGLVTTSSLDIASTDGAGAGATSTTVTTPSVSTTNASDWVLTGWHGGQSTTTDPSSPWINTTHFDDAAVGSGRAAYQSVTSTGSYGGASWTLGTSKQPGWFTVAFKAVPDVTPPRPLIVNRAAITRAANW